MARLAAKILALAILIGMAACTRTQNKPVEMVCKPGEAKDAAGKCAVRPAGSIGAVPSAGVSPGGSTSVTTPEFAGGAPTGATVGASGASAPPSDMSGLPSDVLQQEGDGPMSSGAGAGGASGPSGPSGGSVPSGLPGATGVSGTTGATGMGGVTGATAPTSPSEGLSGTSGITGTSGASGMTGAPQNPDAAANQVDSKPPVFPTDAPVRADQGAPWVVAKLVIGSQGEHLIRLAFSHVEELSEVEYSAEKKPLTGRGTSFNDGSLVVDTFAMPVTVTFRFNKQSCKLGPIGATRMGETGKPECQGEKP